MAECFGVQNEQPAALGVQNERWADQNERWADQFYGTGTSSAERQADQFYDTGISECLI